MAAIKQSDEIEEYCAHGLRCTNKDTYCWRWHTGGICFFSMCYPKPNGSGYCFNGDNCKLEHPKERENNHWELKSGKVFYFEDPKYQLYMAEQSASKAKPDTETKPIKDVQESPTAEPKKFTRAEKKAIRKAAKKPVSDESWIEIDLKNRKLDDEKSTQDTQQHNTENVPAGTMVDLSTKSTWSAKVKAAEQHIKEHTKELTKEPSAANSTDKQTVPVAADFPELKYEQATAKATVAGHVAKLYEQQTIETQAEQKTEQQAEKQAPQDADVMQVEQFNANENKFSSQLKYINKNFLEDNFDPVHFAQLQSAIQAEFEQMTTQLKLMQEQSNKLRKLQKAYMGYHAKD
jgi:hypothetical protein